MFLASSVLALAVAAPVPVRTAAEVDDAYAIRYNPAGLSLSPGADLRLVLGREGMAKRMGEPAQGMNGIGLFGVLPVTKRLTLGAAVELNDIGGEIDFAPSLALAYGSETMALGVRWTDGIEGPLFSAGLSVRVARWLSAGFSTEDLAENNGRRTYDLALAVRPFGERITIAGRWRLRHGGPINFDEGDPSILLRMEVEPFDGVFVGFSSDLRRRMSAQLAFRFDRFVTGGIVQTAVVGELDALFAEVGVVDRTLPAVVRATHVAVLELTGDLTPPPKFSLFDQRFSAGVYGAAPMLIDGFADNDAVEAVFLKIGPLAIGWGRAAELRAAIARVRRTGRRVDCYLSASADIAYFVASACDAVAMPPSVQLTVDGVAASTLFFADGLRDLGIHVDAVTAGAYKSAPEQFTRSGMSPQQRETTDALLDGVFTTLVEAIAKGRSLDHGKVEALIHAGTQTATEAEANGFVDRVLYPDEIELWLTEVHGGPVSYRKALDLPQQRRPRWSTTPRIAVITVDAAIGGGDSQELPLGFGRTAGGVTVVQALEAARFDDQVVAVVLRVDSPGGDAVASDLIARAVQRLAAVKPVIASLGDVAASGGYYIAAPATEILAQPTTITGSIGVFSLGYSAERFLARLGVQAETLQRGDAAARGTSLRAPTARERAITQREIDAAYRQFLSVVKSARNLGDDAVLAAAGGRVWSGAAAKRLGLVDRFGGLPDAVRRAKKAAGLLKGQPVDLQVLPGDRRGWSDTVRQVVAPPTESARVSALLPATTRAALGVILGVGGSVSRRPMALAPFLVDID